MFDDCSLSYPSSFSLTHALQLSVSDCVINREDHSLFILVSDLTISYQGRILYEGLITLVPTTMGTLTPDQQGGLTSMTLHDLFTLLILPIGTSGYNISEYIPKIKINQHSLLTRKVFSQHNSSTQVFVTGSSSLDYHQS